MNPYCDLYGGVVLNATISMYAYATIRQREDGKIVVNSVDRGVVFECESVSEIPIINGKLGLIKGIYSSVVKRFFPGQRLSFELTTYVDAPPGSGLGCSSILAVAKHDICLALRVKEVFPEIDSRKSVVVGDSSSDMEFGKRIGALRVKIGFDKDYTEFDYCFDSLLEFSLNIIQHA